jgi:hypothetical protein
VSGWGFLWGVIGAALAWLLTEFVGRPFRQFFDLRREVSSSLVQYGNVPARANMKGDAREPIELTPDQDARLSEAQATFRRLGGAMRAFANVEYFANRIVTWFGFDAYEISKALIGYSNEIPTYGERRTHLQHSIEKLLRIRSNK